MATFRKSHPHGTSSRFIVGRLVLLVYVSEEICGVMAIERNRLMRREHKAGHRHPNAHHNVPDLRSMAAKAVAILSPDAHNRTHLPAYSAAMISDDPALVKLEETTPIVARTWPSKQTSGHFEAHLTATGLAYTQLSTEAPSPRKKTDLPATSFVIESSGIAPIALNLAEHAQVPTTPMVAAAAPQAAPTVAPIAPTAPAAPAADTVVTTAAPADSGGFGIFFILLILLFLGAVLAGIFVVHKKMQQKSGGGKLEGLNNKDDSQFWKSAKTRQSYRRAQLEQAGSGNNDDSDERAATSGTQSEPEDGRGRGSASASNSYRGRRSSRSAGHSQEPKDPKDRVRGGTGLAEIQKSDTDVSDSRPSTRAAASSRSRRHQTSKDTSLRAQQASADEDTVM
jgi:hypothetical protein